MSHEDIAIAFTNVGWNELVKLIQSTYYNDSERQDVVDFIDSADKHRTNPNGEHYLEFNFVSDADGTAMNFFMGVDKISIDEWYAIYLADDGTQNAYGNWTSNSFGMEVIHTLSFDAFNTVVEADSGIKLPTRTTPKPPAKVSINYWPVKQTSYPVVTPAVNDHTCVACGNSSLSKTEASCWRCGHKI